MTTEADILSDLVEINFIRMVDDIPVLSKMSTLTEDRITNEVLDTLKNLKVGRENVMVAGYVKSGSHFLLQILNQLGYKRMYGESNSNGFIVYILCLYFCFGLPCY